MLSTKKRNCHEVRSCRRKKNKSTARMPSMPSSRAYVRASSVSSSLATSLWTCQQQVQHVSSYSKACQQRVQHVSS
jgi:hypothetical protein